MKKHDIDQRTDEWLHVRKGKITGTGLKALMGTPYARDQFFYEILAERLTVGVDDGEENAMDRGVRLEDEAVAAFEMEVGKKVEKVGFVEDDTNSSIAISPDGLIGESEAVEIKCMGGKNHVALWLENEVPKDYYWQVVQYFVVNENLKKLYFVGYNPDIPVHPLHIIEVERSKVLDDIEKARETQKEFLQKVDDKLRELIEL